MQWNRQTFSGWGRVHSAEAEIARPERLPALSAALAGVPGILASGNLRSYGDAALPAGGHALSTRRLDRLLEFDGTTGLLHAEAGVTMGELVRVFAPRGWIPAVLPGTGATTLGGAIANDVHGKNHHAVGSFGQHVASVTLAGPDGGLRRITPEDAPELFRATVGGLGQTGVIVSAELRLIPCRSTNMRVKERRMAGLDAFLEAFSQSRASFEVGWIDALAGGARLGRGLLEEAEFSTSLGPPPRCGKPMMLPPVPGFSLATPVVRAFNTLYFARVPKEGRTRVRKLEKFFFPLDRLGNWNILYGRKGFHQFQCVLPDDTAPGALRAMLRDVSACGLASPLAVLKRMGPGRAGYLSFAREGYTLALDIPNRAGAAALIGRLIDTTCAAGGRIYFAKDSLAGRDCIARMYPELDDWRRVVAEADPERRFASRLTDRLGLRDAA